MYEGECSVFIRQDFVETVDRCRHQPRLLDGLEDVSVLLLDGIVPHPVLALVAVALQGHLLPNAVANCKC